MFRQTRLICFGATGLLAAKYRSVPEANNTFFIVFLEFQNSRKKIKQGS